MIGQTIANKYKIKTLIGRGGFGSVYLAEKQGAPDELKHVAIKSLPTLRSAQAFIKEAKALSNLKHPSIIKLKDIIFEKERGFLVMEYVSGSSLEYLLKEQSFSPAQSLQIILTITEALAYSHRKGIFHQDIKPFNIMIADQDKSIKLLDFGIASLEGNRSPNQLALGTPHYLPPEVFMTEASIPKETVDLYALGCVFFYLLNGKPAFVSGDMKRLMQEKQQNLQNQWGQRPIPLAYRQIVERLLSPQKRNRYVSAEALLLDLKALYLAEKNAMPLPNFNTPQSQTFPEPESLRLVGRKDGLEKLRQSLEKAFSNQGQAILIDGLSGSGKSRFVRTFLNKAKRFGFSTASAAALEITRSSSMYVFQELFESVAQSLQECDQNKIKESLGDDIAIIQNSYPGTQKFLGKAERENLIEEEGALFLAVKKLLKSLGPTVIWADDLQWADAASLRLFVYLSRQLDDLPILLIGSIRSEDKKVLAHLKSHMPYNSYHLHLKPLKVADIATITNQVLPSLRPSNKIFDEIFKASLGLPLLILEALRKLFELGDEIHDPDKCLKVLNRMRPTNILVSRLNRLSPLALETLKAASVFGSHFFVDDVRSVMQQNTSLSREIHKALALNLVVEQIDGSYRFTHDKIREHAYASLSAKEKQIYHIRIVYRLKNKNPENYAELAIEHYEKAGYYRDAFLLAISAAKKAKQKKSYPIALAHLQRAFDWLLDNRIGCSAEMIFELSTLKAELLSYTAHYQEAKREIFKLLDLKKHPEQKSFLLNLLADVYLRQGNISLAMTTHIEALKGMGMAAPQTKLGFLFFAVSQFTKYGLTSLFPKLKKPISKADERLKAEKILLGLEKYCASAVFLKPLRGLIMNVAAVNLANRLGITPGSSLAYLWHSVFLSSLPLCQRALRYHKKGEEMAHLINDPYLKQRAAIDKLICHYAAGNWDQALKACREGEKYYPEVQDKFLFGSLLCLKPLIYWRQAQFENLESAYSKAELVLQENDDIRNLGTCLMYQPQIFIERGMIKTAHNKKDELKKYALLTNDTALNCMLLSACSQLSLLKSQPDKALELIDQSNRNLTYQKQWSLWTAPLAIHQVKTLTAVAKQQPRIGHYGRLLKSLVHCLRHAYPFKGFRSEALAAMAEAVLVLGFRKIALRLSKKASEIAIDYQTPVGHLYALQMGAQIYTDQLIKNRLIEENNRLSLSLGTDGLHRTTQAA